MSQTIPRVIPSLLIKKAGLYKTLKFADERYVGDPVNAVRIFNEKRVDELCILDIECARNRSEINYPLLADIASEAFMPLSYGGGVCSLQQVEQLVTHGFERVVVNSAAIADPNLVERMVQAFGTSTIIAGIDVKRDWLGRPNVVSQGGRQSSKLSPVAWAQQLEQLGVGEILLTSVDRDGSFKGFDLDLIASVTKAVQVPVIASGGAATLADFHQATTHAHASAVSAGSMFVFHGKHKAVLISYPSPQELRATWA